METLLLPNVNNENQSYIHLHFPSNRDPNPSGIRIQSQEVPRKQPAHTILEDEKWASQEVEERIFRNVTASHSSCVRYYA